MCKPIVMKKRIISVVSILLMLLVVMYGVNQFSQFIDNECNYKKNIEMVNNEAKRYLYTLIYDEQDKAKTVLENKVENIQNTIIDEYGEDKELLENDIKNPIENSKLSKIFDNELYNYDSKIIVGTMDKILWNRLYGEYSMNIKDYYTWEDVIYSAHNNYLSKEAIDTIVQLNIQKNDFIIWQSGKSNIDLVENDIKILLDEFEKCDYDINELKGYEILIPVYITSDGDIFGVKDVDSIGRFNDNCKMILVQKLNLYDILKDQEQVIEKYKDEMLKIQYMAKVSTKDEIVRNIYLLIIVIGIVTSSGAIQNRIKE